MLKQSKRVIYNVQKVLKLPNLSDKDKFLLGIYKAEAFSQLGNFKQGIATLKETSNKSEYSMRASFGVNSPMIEEEQTSKQIFLINYINMALNEETEKNSKELQEALKTLLELTEQKKPHIVTPYYTTAIYSFLRKGSFI